MMISIKNFNKSFGNIHSVKNLNIKVQEGEIYGFLGPNGAGKSTTIKTLVGIYKKDSGDIKIAGYDLEDLRSKQVIGYIPDEPYVYDRLNAREFLEFIAEIYKMPAKIIKQEVDTAISLFSIDEDINIQIQDFSRGSKQKLVISAALMHKPKILIIDEPMVGLDPRSSIKMIGYLKEFAKNGGTVFVSTHTLDVATKICDRVGIIDKGELKVEGSITELESITKEKSLEDVFLKITNG